MKKTDHKIVIVGSGFLGMNMAIQLLKEGIDNFIILEASNEVGGVWRDNSYPGAACDIPSHLYSLKSDPYPYWSTLYSPRKEIYEYLKWVEKNTIFKNTFALIQKQPALNITTMTNAGLWALTIPTTLPPIL